VSGRHSLPGVETIAGLLAHHAQDRPTDRAFLFLDEDPAWVSYAELDAAARRVAQALSARRVAGEPVLLLFPPGRAYVEGFLGCLYAGAVAVPAYPPDPSRLVRTVPRLRSLAGDCGAALALTVSWLADAVAAGLGEAPELAAMEWVATDALPDPDDRAWVPPRLPAQAPALLQYTSGSTGQPKGVLLSHANLRHNAELVRTGFGTSPQSVGVSWLPPYHDMGLIGGILQPVYVGLPVVLMSPLAFLQRPMAWLEAVSRFGGTVSGGPNFAFDLCVRKSTPQQRAALDLSSWSVAFCGAEPVRAGTLDRFAAAFAPAGFRAEAFYPCYGLAEGTLIVTGGRPGEAPRRVQHGGTVHVGCGRALGGQTVAIVDPETRTALGPGAVGEIWLSGPSVATGYWHRPDETRQVFQAVRVDDPDRHYLRTGDLGFLDPSGELVVTGRAKDMVIVRGRNIYPQDLEHAVEGQVAGVRPGCSAAFAVDLDGEERVGFAAEVAADGVAVADTVAAIRRVLSEVAEVSPATVVLLRPRCIPKTSSGKIQRHACRRAVAEGEWDAGRAEVVARWDQPGASPRKAGDQPPREAEDQPPREAEDRLPQEADQSEAEDLVGAVAGALGLDRRDVPLDTPLTGLGLDSLQAVELRHALGTRLGLDVTVSELLAGVSVTALAARAPSVPAAPPESPHLAAEQAVSDGQRALWFVQQWAPDSGAYEITRAARICSPLDVPALDRALRALVQRHPALRTRLPSEGGEPVSRLLAWDGPVADHHDVPGLDDGSLRQRIEADARRGFDLAAGPLFRASLYSRAPEDHVLLLSVHHVVADFWSLSVLVDDLLALYAAELAGVAAGLPELPAAAPAHPAADGQARLDYWRRALAGAPEAVELPTTFPRPRLQSYQGATHELRIDRATLRELDTLARAAGATRFVALMAAFAALLARYAGDDVVVGTPTAGREDHRSARLVGYFVNPVPLRIRVGPGVTFRALMAGVRRVVLDALDHAVPFARLVEAVSPSRDPSRSPLVQVMLTLQQPPAGRPDLGAFAVADETTRVRLGGLDVRPYRLDPRGSAFDLSLMAAEVAGELSCTMEYCTALFDGPAVARLCRQLTGLLAQAVARPDVPVETLELMDGAERAAVAAFADGGRRPLDGPATLAASFTRQVNRRGAATAVVSGRQALTYAELDARADRLAALLRGRFGVRRGSVVGVHLPRGVDWVVAFWAVLKAGGAYLPLTPDLPARRLAWMVGDAAPAVLLTHQGTADQLPAGGPYRFCLDGEWPAGGAAPGGAVAEPDDVAYVIYTSGSTGRPKAVLVPHRGARNASQAEATGLEVTESSRVLQSTSSSFDVSILEILIAHLHGAALHIASSTTVASGEDLVRLLAEERVTIVTTAPSVLAALPDAPLPDLVAISVGGEVCPPELVTRWGAGRRFNNAYGPTETSITATLSGCRPDGTRPSIGRPIPNTSAYVLDARMEPVPVGVPGELYLGGAGVAHGYLGQPRLTAQWFVPDPFGAVPGARLYRTGDRVRWLPDGTLDFLGRLDDQVKIRGVRVEPGEIEVRLRESLDLREAVVVPRPGPGGGTELAAYLVPRGPRLAVAELRGRLRAELPVPWVPAAFVYLDRLPLTANGKLDRRALPAPTPADRGAAERLRPRTELEHVVAQVWAAVLGQDMVGVRDHFFDELGGTSLLVAKVTSQLGDRLGRHVPVTDMFEHPTVEALARHLDRTQRLDRDGTPADASRGTRPEDPAARREDPVAQPEDHAAYRRQALARRNRNRRRS